MSLCSLEEEEEEEEEEGHKKKYEKRAFGEVWTRDLPLTKRAP